MSTMVLTLLAPQDPWHGSELQLVNVDDRDSSGAGPVDVDVEEQGISDKAGQPVLGWQIVLSDSEHGISDKTGQPLLGGQIVLSDSEDHIPATDRTDHLSQLSTTSGPGAAATAPLHTEPSCEAPVVRVGSLVRTSTINREPIEVLAARAELEVRIASRSGSVAASRSTTPLMGLDDVVVTSAKATAAPGGDKEVADPDVEGEKEKGRTDVNEEESECLLLTPSKTRRTQESGFSERNLTPEQV